MLSPHSRRHLGRLRGGCLDDARRGSLRAIRTVSSSGPADGGGALREREVVLLVWLAGLLAVAAVFAWVVHRSMRRDDSPLSLWFMTLTAMLLASPLALMLLQHPSP